MPFSTPLLAWLETESTTPKTPWRRALFPGEITAATAVFTNNLPPEDLKGLSARISPSAVFFIYGEHGQGGGERVPNHGFYAAAGEPKEIWEVPGAQHVGGITTQPAEYERLVIAFFDGALLQD